MGRPMKFERDEAIGKALEVFWSGSYAATTPQELVDCLGIGKGSLYNTFNSKRGLYDLALTEYVRRRSDLLDAMIQRPGPRLEALAYGMGMLVGLDSPEANGCFIVNAVAEHGHGDDVVARAASTLFERIKATFRRCLAEAIAEGDVPPGLDVEQSASQLLAIVIGSGILLRTGDSKMTVRALLHAAIANLQGDKQQGHLYRPQRLAWLDAQKWRAGGPRGADRGQP